MELQVDRLHGLVDVTFRLVLKDLDGDGVERNSALLKHRLLHWHVVIDVKLVLLFTFLLFGGEGRVASARSKGAE